VDLEPTVDYPAFREEAFCSVAAITNLGGADPGAFLDAAAEFCNERLSGTLNATVIIDPATAGERREALDRAVARLRYGTVAVNVWAAAGFVLGTPWGGYPGATLADVQSGVGFVHNSRVLGRVEKTVYTAPFRHFPKPPWFATHRSSDVALQRIAEFEGDPRVARMPGFALAALRS
jgi:aldehyde dehydrogenase (NAD(P)+)